MAGASLAKVSEFKLHGRLMLSAIAFQFGAVFLWMLPSLIRNIGALGSGGVGPAITLSHVYFGAYALCLAIAAARHWKLEMELKWTMRLIFSAWFRGNSRNPVLRALLSRHPLNPDALALLGLRQLSNSWKCGETTFR
jgi:hypothetical protein